MKQHYYPQLDETVYWDKLPNGLTIAVVPKKGFQKKLAYFVTDFGSIHTKFELEGKEYTVDSINTGDEELEAFLFSLGCYSGEPITVIAHRRSGMTVSIKDGRYNLDPGLAGEIKIK